MKVTAASPDRVVQNSTNQLFSKPLFGELEKQLVLPGKIPVYRRTQSLNVEHTEICFQSMSASRRRYRTIRMAGIDFLSHALGRPEQERELIQSQRLIKIASAALTVDDCCCQIHL